MGAPIVDLENLIVEDKESQHGDPNALVKPTPEPITPVATLPITPLATLPITFLEGENPTPETINSVAQNPEPTPKPVLQVHSF